MNIKKQAPRYYVPHHLIFYPVMGICMAMCVYNMQKSEELKSIWVAIGLCFFSVTVLSFMLRQHYALGNQDRIVRLEMRYRYFAISNKRFEPLEQQLSFKQVAALRFASDEELVALLDKVVMEKLSPSEIKNAIKKWEPDYMRL